MGVTMKIPLCASTTRVGGGEIAPCWDAAGPQTRRDQHQWRQQCCDVCGDGNRASNWLFIRMLCQIDPRLGYQWFNRVALNKRLIDTSVNTVLPPRSRNAETAHYYEQHRHCRQRAEIASRLRSSLKPINRLKDCGESSSGLWKWVVITFVYCILWVKSQAGRKLFDIPIYNIAH
jgi:hypothetical protein